MADTRNRLLTATNESFRRRGYNGTSLKHVTEAAERADRVALPLLPGRQGRARRGGHHDLRRRVPRALRGHRGRGRQPGRGDHGLLRRRRDHPRGDRLHRPVPDRHRGPRGGEHERAPARGDGARVRELDRRRDAYLAAAGIAREEAERLALTIVAALEGGFVLARAQRDASVLRETGVVVRRVVEQAAGTRRRSRPLVSRSREMNIAR